MKNHFNKIFTGIFLGILLCNFAIAQPQAKASLDFRVGIPSILTESNPAVAPFGGVGFRYSFNDALSLGININGGTLAGKSKISFFRNNFMTYGAQVYLNPFNFGYRDYTSPWSKFNLYIGAGASQMIYYYTLQNVYIDNKLSRPHFLYEAGLTFRYYINEMIDFTGSSNFYFSQTTKLDNIVGDRKFDAFTLSSIGLSIKFLPYDRRQLLDWTHIQLPYNTGPTALKKSMDSVTAVLRGEINASNQKINNVNAKVDSLDSKMNKVLELLEKNKGGTDSTQSYTSPSIIDSLQINSNNNNTNNSNSTPNSKNNSTNQPNNDKNSSSKNNSSSKEGDNLNNAPKKEVKTSLIYATPEGKKRSQAAILDPKQVKDNYAIVVGSFLVENNALKEREHYIDKGWDAHILGAPKSHFKRIVIFSNNYFEAAKIVTELRQTGQPDTWMLDISTGKGVFIK